MEITTFCDNKKISFRVRISENVPVFFFKNKIELVNFINDWFEIVESNLIGGDNY